MSNELDKYINDRLHNYESEVDAEAIWAAVEPTRRRRPWFLLWLFLGGLGVASGTWWLWESDTSTVTQAMELNDEQVINQYAEDTVLCNQFAAYANVEKEGININNEDNSKTSFLIQENKIDKNSLTKILSPSSQKKALIKDPFKNQFSKTQLNRLTNETNTRPYSVNDSHDDSMNNWGEEEELLNQVTHNVKPRHGLLPLLPNVLKQLTPKNNYDIQFGEDIFKEFKSDSPWSIQADIAYLSIDRTLESDDLTDWVGSRLATESTLEAWSTDLSINYDLSKNWQIRAGLGYTQINSQFSYTSTSTVVDSVEGLQFIIYQANNTIDSVYGPIAATETRVRSQNIYNSIRQWELPILINYQVPLNRFYISAEVGARIRIRRTWEGQLLSQNGEVSAFANQQWYRQGLGVSLQTGLHLGYQLSPQIQVRLGGTLRYTPSDFSKKGEQFKEGYQLFGGQLGVIYHLN